MLTRKITYKYITDNKTKFNYIVSCLETSIAYKIKEVFDKPHNANRYGQIRTALIEVSQKQKLGHKNAKTTGDGAASFKQFTDVLTRLTSKT